MTPADKAAQAAIVFPRPPAEGSKWQSLGPSGEVVCIDGMAGDVVLFRDREGKYRLPLATFRRHFKVLQPKPRGPMSAATNATARRVIDIANALGAVVFTEHRPDGVRLAAQRNLDRVVEAYRAEPDDFGANWYLPEKPRKTR